MPETLTKKEWQKINGRLKQHKKLDAIETEIEWAEEQGVSDPILLEYDELRKLDLSRPAENAEKEIERLHLLMKRHELERKIEHEKSQVSFDTVQR